MGTNFNLGNPGFWKPVDDSCIVREKLVLHLDAADWRSYPGTGTTWKDLSGRGRNIEILATAFNNAGRIKYMDFNGSYGCAKFQNSDFVPNAAGIVTALVWTRILTSVGNWRTLFRALSTGSPHQVIVEAGGYGIGMYSGAFRNTGYQQTSIPGWNTGKWNMLVWRWPAASPYYQFGYNDTPSLASSVDSNATFSSGICSIGAYNDANQNSCGTASQYWGDISSVMMYDKYLSNAEIIQVYQSQKNRFGL